MNTKRRLAIGDIHGGNKALIQVLERAKFDPQNDHIFFIGDVADGWPETQQCIDTLLSIPHFTAILGNHDVWAWEWMKTGAKPHIWLSQGGIETINSYTLSWQDPNETPPKVPTSHLDYFKNALPYYITDDNILLVHGGFNPAQPIETQSLDTLTWDRTLYETALYTQQTQTNPSPLSTYKKIFIGHTSTASFSLEPVNACEVWNIDQGGGWEGKLTIIDIDTHEFWSSDIVKTLYPNSKGR